MKLRHFPTALRRYPRFVLRHAPRMLAHTFRGSTWRSALGLEDRAHGVRALQGDPPPRARVPAGDAPAATAVRLIAAAAGSRVDVGAARRLSTCSSSDRIPTTSRSAWAARSPDIRRPAIASALRSHARRAGAATARPKSGGAKPRPRPGVLGAAWRVNLGWPDGGITGIAEQIAAAVRSDPALRVRAPSRFRTGTIGIRITSPRATPCGQAAFKSGLRRFRPSASLAAGLGLLLLHQRRRRAVVRRRCVGALRAQARGAGVLSQPVRRWPETGAVATRLTAPDVSPGSSRAATRSSARSPACSLPKASSCASRCSASRPAQARAMKIGMVCYASVGGSGVVATELAHALAERGHDVTLISSEPPFRWRPDVRGPVVRSASRSRRIRCFASRNICWRWPTRCARVAHERAARHRSRPLRRAARHRGLSRRPDRRSHAGTATPRTMTTLHGTDITLVGSDPSYARVVAFSIEQSACRDRGVREPASGTRCSALGVAPRDPGHRQLSRLRGVPAARPIRRCARTLVPAAVRGARHSRLELPAGQARGRGDRGVPRAFARRCRARFVLLGDGPVRAARRASGCREAGLGE